MVGEIDEQNLRRGRGCGGTSRTAERFRRYSFAEIAAFMGAIGIMGFMTFNDLGSNTLPSFGWSLLAAPAIRRSS